MVKVGVRFGGAYGGGMSNFLLQAKQASEQIVTRLQAVSRDFVFILQKFRIEKF